VKEEDGTVMSEPGGSAGMAPVPTDLEEAVVEASEECPGECIFIEKD
jgi:ferredoxin